MIRLKSGKMVELINDFDLFFQQLMKDIASDAYQTSSELQRNNPGSDFSALMLKELMDESIYVSHQLFDLAQHNEKLAKFLLTGFIFNSLALSVPYLSENRTNSPQGDTFH